MNTLKQAVKSLLDGALDCPVYYQYPAAWASLPVAAWYESGNHEAAQADGAEYLTECTYTIDLWALTPEENDALAAAAHAALAGARFKRVLALDLYEPENRLHHKTLRYRALTAGGGVIYQ